MKDHLLNWHEKFQPLGPALKTPRIEVDEKSAIAEFEERSFDHPACTGGNAPALSPQALVPSLAGREFKVGDRVRLVPTDELIDGVVVPTKPSWPDAIWVRWDSGLTLPYDAYVIKHLSQPSDTQQWVEWKGGECPVPADAHVEYRMRGYGRDCRATRADILNWSHSRSGGDILSYRVVQ